MFKRLAIGAALAAAVITPAGDSSVPPVPGIAEDEGVVDAHGCSFSKWTTGVGAFKTTTVRQRCSGVAYQRLTVYYMSGGYVRSSTVRRKGSGTLQITRPGYQFHTREHRH